MVVVEVTVIPIGTGSPSLSDYVARALKELRGSDLEYEFTSTGTIIEGELEEVLSMVKRMHESVFDKDVSRVVTILEIDDRRDKDLSIEGKKKSTEEKLKKC